MTPASVPAGSGPRQVTIHPSGKYAYVACFDFGTIFQYTIDPNSGALTPMTTATVATGTAPLTLAVDPSGKYAYVTNSGDNDISQYTIGADGSLTAMPNTVPTGSNPWSIVTVKN
jgi:6-phosphogluconolactonase (cycloisomerase 2 family)